MRDEDIIGLYWKRDEHAISESQQAYGGYCSALAYRILASSEDAEECVNDTWLRAWNAIPPQQPVHLRQFFGRITRNLAFNRSRESMAEKRNRGELPLVLDELAEIVSDDQSAEDAVLTAELGDAVNRFLWTLSRRDRSIFVRRYYAVESIQEIAKRFAMRPGSVSVVLTRVRQKLRNYLTQEGYLT